MGEHLLITRILTAKVTGKIVEVKEKGEVVEKQPIVSLQLEIDGFAGQCDKLMQYLANDQPVQVSFDSAQLPLPMKD